MKLHDQYYRQIDKAANFKISPELQQELNKLATEISADWVDPYFYKREFIKRVMFDFVCINATVVVLVIAVLVFCFFIAKDTGDPWECRKGLDL